jgi:hypothetical protein
MGLEKDREHLLIVTGAAEQRLIARVETGGHLGAGLNWSAAESAIGADADDQRASAPGEFPYRPTAEYGPNSSRYGFDASSSVSALGHFR